jgi:REP element-mobilizing transposase RayT
MGYARKSLVSLNDTPYYHVVARCVRRAWLCGVDDYAGRDYSHRKEWVLERLQQLSSIFTIEICAYAVMSNHYHLVLYVDRAKARKLSEQAVVSRWTRIFRQPDVVTKFLGGEAKGIECERARLLIERWRSRLYDISWFMKSLNEYLARRANAEDNCTGKFWEGRFKSQALLDQSGLLTAMTYVDLNPVRAGIAASPDEFQFTSLYERLRAVRSTAGKTFSGRVQLKSFKPGAQCDAAIPYSLRDYLALIDWTCRMIRNEASDAHRRLPSITRRLNIDATAWVSAMQPRGNVFGRAMGKLDHMRLHAKTLGQSWVRGIQAAVHLFS